MAVIKPVLVVIGGPNGSGKTEITKALRKYYPQWTKDLVEVNPDVIAQEEFGGWNDLASIRKAAQRADEIREKCLIERRGLLFETVLSIPEKVDFIHRAKQAGFFIRFVYVATNNAEINMLRVAWRVDKGGHTVPEDKIRSRYERSLRMALEVARIVDRAYFIDNSRDINEQVTLIEAQPIFRMVNGTVAKIYLPEEDFPQWTKAIYQGILSDPNSSEVARQ